MSGEQGKTGNDISKGMQSMPASQQARQMDSLPAKPPFEDNADIEEVPAQVRSKHGSWTFEDV